MPFPPWTRELLSGSLDDVSKKLQSLETVRELQSRASSLLGDLPITAARSLDRLLQETRKGTDHLRRWVRRQTVLNLSAINGSGVYFHPSVEGAPIQHDAAEKMLRSADFFALSGGLASQRIEQRFLATIEQRFDSRVLFAASVPAAILAVAASISTHDSIVMPRAYSIRLGCGSLIPDVLAGSGRTICEIGSSDQCLPDDWNAAVRSCTPSSLAFTIDWPTQHLSSSANDRGSNVNERLTPPPESFRSVQYVPFGCLQVPTGLEGQCSLIDKATVASHWLTIVPSHFMLAGPVGAMILGTEHAIVSVSKSRVWTALQANLHDKAALAVALEAASPDQVPRASLQTLMSVSVENLQNRAERLATQLAGESAFQSCRITQDAARLSYDLSANIPSRQVMVAPAGNCLRLRERLLKDAPALITEQVENELKLDFRWIPSHLDAGIVGLLTEQEIATEPEAPVHSETN